MRNGQAPEDPRVDDRLDVHDREPVTVPFAGWWSPSAMPNFGRYLRRERNRERLIDATLELCAAFGYEATTVDQIAAAANVAPDHFVDYFESKDAVLMAVLDDAQQAIAAAFAHVGSGINPEQALLTAIVEDLAVISDGCGVATAERLAALAQTVRAHADLDKHASAAELTRIAGWN
jgi:AcrR family transcriptional regulator